jgi:hypothetical protein
MLHEALKSTLSARYATHAARIRELASPLSNAQFWKRPFSFGNSFGHLVLHLTGNLNYYIGAQIADTGYVRDRPREFTESNPSSKEDVLRLFDDAVAMVRKTLDVQSEQDWSKPYSATGSEAPNRLAIFIVCESHMQLHIGQMIYLDYETQRQRNN